jgi:hypothetical protein
MQSHYFRYLFDAHSNNLAYVHAVILTNDTNEYDIRANSHHLRRLFDAQSDNLPFQLRHRIRLTLLSIVKIRIDRRDM